MENQIFQELSEENVKFISDVFQSTVSKVKELDNEELEEIYSFAYRKDLNGKDLFLKSIENDFNEFKENLSDNKDSDFYKAPLMKTRRISKGKFKVSDSPYTLGELFREGKMNKLKSTFIPLMSNHLDFFINKLTERKIKLDNLLKEAKKNKEDVILNDFKSILLNYIINIAPDIFKPNSSAFFKVHIKGKSQRLLSGEYKNIDFSEYEGSELINFFDKDQDLGIVVVFDKSLMKQLNLEIPASSKYDSLKFATAEYLSNFLDKLIHLNRQPNINCELAHQQINETAICLNAFPNLEDGIIKECNDKLDVSTNHYIQVKVDKNHLIAYKVQNSNECIQASTSYEDFTDWFNKSAI